MRPRWCDCGCGSMGGWRRRRVQRRRRRRQPNTVRRSDPAALNCIAARLPGFGGRPGRAAWTLGRSQRELAAPAACKSPTSSPKNTQTAVGIVCVGSRAPTCRRRCRCPSVPALGRSLRVRSGRMLQGCTRVHFTGLDYPKLFMPPLLSCGCRWQCRSRKSAGRDSNRASRTGSCRGRGKSSEVSPDEALCSSMAGVQTWCLRPEG